ncbi:MAG: hypothetical protein UR61_C0060G0003 [candidate division WS6 bacterium GW2011_GWE1_34_7]|uniref:Uncharacterized protein n=1 Tax=candidate division WS6 bacterium GW2011_GWE1_34_7 TaxID=1619093 RepID=A0A0G0B3H7_9BACT|nr:MAG: hypothetical protein UR61_C0060G0003 [candidate division WS6 bacterium GW2011_GWE1_34_7]
MINNEVEGSEFGLDSEGMRALLVDEVAKAIFLGQITDDNPSPSNGKTSLDQLLEWEFDIEGEDGMRQLKTDVFARVLELRGGCDMFGYDDVIF